MTMVKAKPGRRPKEVKAAPIDAAPDVRHGALPDAAATAGAEPAPLSRRMYYVHPLWIGALDQWPVALQACADLGFDSVACPWPFVAATPIQGQDLRVPSGIERLHPVFSYEGDALQGIAALADLCIQHGLKLVLDLNLDQADVEGSFVAGQPNWYRWPDWIAESDRRIDPRYLSTLRGGADRRRIATLALADDNAQKDFIDVWSKRLASLAEAGVTGFRCLGLAEAFASCSLTTATNAGVAQRWQALIAQTRALSTATSGQPLFMAWTPGLTPQQLRALGPCGFDATFSSSCWWDYRSSWLVEDYERLHALSADQGSAPLPVLAFAQIPWHGATPCAARNAASQQRSARRALDLAASTGDGWLVTMGFEHGLRLAMDPCRGSPDEYAAACAASASAPGAGLEARFDLRETIIEANRFIADATKTSPTRLQSLSAPDAAVALLLRSSPYSKNAVLIAVNTELEQPQMVGSAEVSATHAALQLPTDILLDPGQIRRIDVRRSTPLTAASSSTVQLRRRLQAALQAPRIAIENPSPAVDGDPLQQLAVRRIVGDTVTVEADVLIDGHDHMAVSLLWRRGEDTAWQRGAMTALGNDRWQGRFVLDAVGPYAFKVEAWFDRYGSLCAGLEKKVAAGQDVALEVEEARLLVVETIAQAADDEALLVLKNVVEKIQKKAGKVAIEVLLAAQTRQAMAASEACAFLVQSAPQRIDSERLQAEFSAWYELFPRSQKIVPLLEHGTFDDVIHRLPAIRAMGFDVLYFPPIHPIGKTHRKGRNNSLTASAGDPGSPYAIGSDEGGHDAIHPQLGSFDDFKNLLLAAQGQGLEIALDFAIQCSPDHPWLREHPEWFAWRPDGSVRHAENPPKKYEDIVNVDFYAGMSFTETLAPSKQSMARMALWQALRDIVLFWIDHGVRIFRVDNPHTKPLPFWQWLIAEVRALHPDAIFLAEAFTRPKMMARLAKVGFTQSYTYFTWRHSKAEFTEYMNTLAQPPLVEYFRPHFFVNTPDINPYFLQHSGRAGFVVRAALASLLSGLWGMYSGFELCEGEPVPGKEEYLDSEKYTLRPRDWQQPGNIIGEISLLNRIRRNQPALHTHRGIRFYHADNEQVLYFCKSTPTRDNVILVAINLDAHQVQETHFEVPLWEWGLRDDASVDVEDLVWEQHFTWHGKWQHVRLDPKVMPFAVWRVKVEPVPHLTLPLDGEGTKRKNP